MHFAIKSGVKSPVSMFFNSYIIQGAEVSITLATIVCIFAKKCCKNVQKLLKYLWTPAKENFFNYQWHLCHEKLGKISSANEASWLLKYWQNLALNVTSVEAWHCLIDERISKKLSFKNFGRGMCFFSSPFYLPKVRPVSILLNLFYS